MGDLKICDGRFLDAGSGYSVIFDDDGRVAYAYLLDGEGGVVGDVWLYNRCKAPSVPEWRSPELMPFANPEGFVKEVEGFAPVSNISEVDVGWGKDGLGAVTASIYIHGLFFAFLVEGIKPGWSISAEKDGPLAKVLKPAT